MLVGLQGSGKTTTIGKLGNLLIKKYNKKPLFVACDIYRPAAIEQLKTIGKELNIPVYEEGIKNPNEIVRNALEYAKENKLDYILIDTAGRLHVDEELMNELKSLNEEFNPETSQLLYDSNGRKGMQAIRLKPRMTANYGYKLHFEGHGYVRFYEMELGITPGGELFVSSR